MELDGAQLIEGKMYLWKLPGQTVQAKDLHSIYFVTDEKAPRFFEVVFAKPSDANPVPGWYLVEKEVKPHDTTPEAEVVEPEAVTEQDGGTLSISVDDELKLGEMLR